MRHLCARDGNYLLVPFQCDLCHFRDLTHRNPGQAVEDVKLIVSIRQANLDAFWAREPGTVVATRREVVKIGKLGNLIGLTKLFPAMGPFPLEDIIGMGIAVCMLQRSLEKGRYRDTLQFETVRKLRSTYSNIWHTSRQTLTTSVIARDLKKTHVTSCPTYGLWFERFIVARSNSKLHHVVLPLRGRLKGETGETFHFVVVTAKSNSGLEIGPWIEMGIALRERRGVYQGYFFTTTKGK